jgi:AraC family transcriptional regulator, positive regulator of tynA and feaB
VPNRLYVPEIAVRRRQGIEPRAFTGWVRPVSVCGFSALDFGCNAHRIERTCRDARLDGVDHYFTIFQVDGRSAMTHNGEEARLAAGDVALVDAARPATFLADNGGEPWNTVTLNLPRDRLISYLGWRLDSQVLTAGDPLRTELRKLDCLA